MKENRSPWISMAQVSASFAVVMLHCNGVFWQFPSGRLWYTSNFIECFFYWAVPVFFMLSGATLLDYQKRYSTRIFLKKRFTRVIIPFLSWSFIGIAYVILVNHQKIQGGVKGLFDGIINTRFISIYWYFIPLIGVYLCIPFAAAIEEKMKIRVYLYSVITGIIFVSVIPTICNIFTIPFNSGIIPAMFNGYILYTLIGYIIRNVEMRSRDRKILYVFGIVGFAFQYFGTDILSRNSGGIDQTFKGYLNFPAVLQAVAVIVMFRYIPYDRLNERFISFVEKISKHTFGVYLMHIYFVWQIPQVLKINPTSIYYRTFGAILIFCLCILLCWMLSKVPVLNKILGC